MTEANLARIDIATVLFFIAMMGCAWILIATGISGLINWLTRHQAMRISRAVDKVVTKSNRKEDSNNICGGGGILKGCPLPKLKKEAK